MAMGLAVELNLFAGLSSRQNLPYDVAAMGCIYLDLKAESFAKVNT